MTLLKNTWWKATFHLPTVFCQRTSLTVRLITLKMLECSWNFVGKQIVSNYTVDYIDQLLLDQKRVLAHCIICIVNVYILKAGLCSIFWNFKQMRGTWMYVYIVVMWFMRACVISEMVLVSKEPRRKTWYTALSFAMNRDIQTRKNRWWSKRQNSICMKSHYVT